MANSEVREDELSWRKRIVFRELGILLALLFMVGCLSLFAPRFLESENLFNVLRQFSFITIIAIGQTFVITAAGIDLSVGSVAGLAGIVTCSAIATGMGVTEVCSSDCSPGHFAVCSTELSSHTSSCHLSSSLWR